MLSQKFQNDLMTAYQKVHEAKRGHAAGADDSEKQASQLASDVRYKAKGKLKPGASEEEKKKVFLQILGSSPAPNAVKAMAKSKLLGEGTEDSIIKGSDKIIKTEKERREKSDFKPAKGSKLEKTVKREFPLPNQNNSYEPEGEVIDEMRFDDGKEGTKKRLKALEKKRGMKMPNHPQFKTEEKAPRMQKGAMAYDGPNKPASEARDRLLMKAKKKREKMQMNSYKPEGEVVSEMGGIKVKPKPKDKNPQNMALPKNVKSGVNYQAMSQSYEPVGNIFNEKKMDPVGQEDGDINNDGKKDGTDKYLMNRRKAIGKAIAKKRGKVKEGFSAWRIDLDFNEQVKK